MPPSANKEIPLDTGGSEKHYGVVEMCYVDNLKKPCRAATLGAFAFLASLKLRLSQLTLYITSCFLLRNAFTIRIRNHYYLKNSLPAEKSPSLAPNERQLYGFPLAEECA